MVPSSAAMLALAGRVGASNEERDRQRIHADAPHLDDQRPQPCPDVGQGTHHVRHEVAHPADRLDGGDGAAAYGLNHGGKTRPKTEGAQHAAPLPSHNRRGYAAKLASALPTSPSRSRFKARSRSWRTRSRVTPSIPPISSSVCSRPPSKPKYRRSTFASRRCRVLSACSISSDRKRSIA